MTLPTTEQIINMYLYGQLTTPTVNPATRAANATTTIAINSEEYMQTVGRFATGDQFNIVQKFFDSSIVLTLVHTYKKTEMAVMVRQTQVN